MRAEKEEVLTPDVPRWSALEVRDGLASDTDSGRPGISSNGDAKMSASESLESGKSARSSACSARVAKGRGRGRQRTPWPDRVESPVPLMPKHVGVVAGRTKDATLKTFRQWQEENVLIRPSVGNPRSQRPSKPHDKVEGGVIRLRYSVVGMLRPCIADKATELPRGRCSQCFVWFAGRRE